MKKLPKLAIFIFIFIFMSLVEIWRLISYEIVGQWQYWIPILMTIVGALVGYIVLELDRIVDIYIANPQTKLAVTVKNYFTHGQIRNGFKILFANKQLQTRLTFHSALFQAVWIFLAFFTITSTPSAFGKAFILGLGLHLLLEQWQDFLANKTFLKQWLFWQINRSISDKDLKIYLSVISILMAYFLFLFIR
jgi:hypothetical protein